MNSVVTKGDGKMDVKRVSISSKRQITIPQKFFSFLGFDDEAECTVRGNELVIRPVKNSAGGEFAEQILAELISQGVSGDELLAKFKDAQKKVRPAVQVMLEEASAAAKSKSDYETYDDVFASED